MPLGELTKQLAQQALLSATAKDPPAREQAPAPPADNTGAVILGVVGSMQRALKEDEELALYFQNGADTIRALEIVLPSPKVAVLTFADSGGFARVIAPVSDLRLVARVQKAKPGVKPHRIALIAPKA